MLTHYGLWFTTPNAQNRLIEMDKNMMPTGRIFFRDLSDSKFNKQVAKALNFAEVAKADIRRTVSKIDPRSSLAYWQLSRGNMTLDQVLEPWKDLRQKQKNDTQHV